jgi:haloalkane dehalogenase
MFVELVLPSSVIRKLSEEEMEVYRKPFAKAGEDRRPTLTWPRMIPIKGEPAEVVKVVPNLFLYSDPGSILVGRQRKLCRAWPNQTAVTSERTPFPSGG